MVQSIFFQQKNSPIRNRYKGFKYSAGEASWLDFIKQVFTEQGQPTQIGLLESLQISETKRCRVFIVDRWVDSPERILTGGATYIFLLLLGLWHHQLVSSCYLQQGHVGLQLHQVFTIKVFTRSSTRYQKGFYTSS